VVVGFVGWWVVGEPLEGFFHHDCLSAEQLLAELAVAVDDDEFDADGGLAKAAAAAQRLTREGQLGDPFVFEGGWSGLLGELRQWLPSRIDSSTGSDGVWTVQPRMWQRARPGRPGLARCDEGAVLPLLTGCRQPVLHDGRRGRAGG
jgi:hypothetical protein